MALLPIIATPAAAQSPELMAAYRQYKMLSEQGRYAEAELFAREALKLGATEFGPDHPNYAILLNNMAVIHDGLRRYAAAEPLYKRALEIREKALGPEHELVGKTLARLAGLYFDQGRYTDAKPLLERSLAIQESSLGPDHPKLAPLLHKLATLYQRQGDDEEGAPLMERALAIREKALGPRHRDVGESLINLAKLHARQGRYDEAERLGKRALAIVKEVYGLDHPLVAIALNNIAEIYRQQGRLAEAEPLYERSLAIDEKALGANHPSVATTLNNLAALYYSQGRYSNAEPLYERSIAIVEVAFGPDHASLAETLGNLGLLHKSQGRFGVAERLYDRSLAIAEKAYGPNHRMVGQSLRNLADLYQTQGRYTEAEPLNKRSLAIAEKVDGPDHPTVGLALNNLAELYRHRGRYAEATPLYERASVILEAALGSDHAEVASALNNQALNYTSQGRYDDAEPLYQRALESREKAFGPSHSSTGITLNNLADLYQLQARYDEARPLYERAIEIWEAALGPEHPRLGIAVNNLGLLHRAEGRYTEAEPLFERGLAIDEKAFGPDHPGVATSLNNLSELYGVLGRHRAALDLIRRASAIYRERSVRSAGLRFAGELREQGTAKPIFLRHVQAAFDFLELASDGLAPLISESFEVGQMALATSAGTAIDRMSARFAAGDGVLADRVRAHQDAVQRWRRLDGEVVKAMGRPAAARETTEEARLHDELEVLDRRLKELSDDLAKDFPDYAELAAPRPVSIAEIQGLLGDDEALLAYAVWDKTTFIWVVRKDYAEIHRVEYGGASLARAVTALRRGVRIEEGSIPRFDTERAYDLYRKIFVPAERRLAGARHVFVVPDSALQSLPLGVLVTKQPPEKEGMDFLIDSTDYRQVPWLARKYAMTTLPSVSALRALRKVTKGSAASKPFIGIGDPKLDGETGSGRGIDIAELLATRGVADVELVRELPSLPDSADELMALAKSLGVGDEALTLGSEATETWVKSGALADGRVIAFATHGLLAGELKGLAEPALVLTPPAKGTSHDDGLLTASEVAQLKLDADWVILSACNTAAADGTPGAEGLSGLAKAFFYAGSRALLVSHWPVETSAAVKLTTAMLAGRARNPEIGRAEALQRSMLALMVDDDKPFYGHPMFWAPFVVVGEGGAAREGQKK